jgi:biotin transporter BioY
VQLTLVGKIQSLKRNSRVGQVIVILLIAELLFLACFASIPLPVATQGNIVHAIANQADRVVEALPSRWQEKLGRLSANDDSEQKPVRIYQYFPQAPLVIFSGYVLGPILAPIACLAFLIIGFAGPVLGFHIFSSGGPYFLQPGFGYLLGMLIASWACGYLTSKTRTSFRQCLAVLAGLVCIHITGLIYLFCISLFNAFGEAPHVLWKQWVFEEARNLSWYPLPYDLLFATILIGIGFPFRWLVDTLCAPDIAFRGKSQPNMEEIESDD